MDTYDKVIKEVAPKIEKQAQAEQSLAATMKVQMQKRTQILNELCKKVPVAQVLKLFQLSSNKAQIANDASSC